MVAGTCCFTFPSVKSFLTISIRFLSRAVGVSKNFCQSLPKKQFNEDKSSVLLLYFFPSFWTVYYKHLRSERTFLISIRKTTRGIFPFFRHWHTFLKILTYWILVWTWWTYNENYWTWRGTAASCSSLTALIAYDLDKIYR